MSAASLAEDLGRLAALLLADLRAHGEGGLSLHVHDDGLLRWRLPAGAWAEETPGARLSRALEAAGRWSLVAKKAGFHELELDLGDRTGAFQSPEVLLRLRAEAAACPEVPFRVELPAGVRDIQRARAGLDSSRGSR